MGHPIIRTGSSKTQQKVLIWMTRFDSSALDRLELAAHPFAKGMVTALRERPLHFLRGALLPRSKYLYNRLPVLRHHATNTQE
jgi:hypothetical protein